MKKKTQKARLEQGEARVTHVKAKDGAYVRTYVEYRSVSADQAGLSEEIAKQMVGAARSIDLRVLAIQREDDIIEGEILTPDGTMVVEKWIPDERELHVLKARRAKMQDLADLPVYAEDPAKTDERKAKARRMLAVAALQVPEGAPDAAEVHA